MPININICKSCWKASDATWGKDDEDRLKEGKLWCRFKKNWKELVDINSEVPEECNRKDRHAQS